MKKQYLIAIIVFALAFGLSNYALAGEDDHEFEVGASIRSTTTMPNKLLEAQRLRLKAEVEARRKTAQAKGDATTTRRETMKLEIEAKWEEMDAKREALRVDFEAKRASSTERRIELQQDIAKRKVEHTAKVMAATIERLEKIASRIDSRISKFDSKGASTTEAKAHVVEARVELNEAKEIISAFATIDLSGDKLKENFERIKEIAGDAREHIRSAHNHLMLAVRSLRANDNDDDDDDSNSTTSPSSL